MRQARGEPPRYAADRGFPSYAFVPGQHPHPTRNPAGHSYGHEVPGRYLPPEAWRDNADYLFGVDLFNHGYLWESHEYWEALWLGAKRADPTQARFLQGLIQLAAAGLKVPMAQPSGLAKLSRTGSEHLEAVAAEAGARYMGLAIAPFVEEFRAFAASQPRSIEARPRLLLEA